MKRVIEWILAGIAAIMCILGAAFIWIPQAADNPPGFSLWPLPGIFLTEVALLGVVGFLGIALEPRQYLTSWGYLVWIASGALLGLSILGDFSVSVVAIFAAPALAFGGAAILADHRRKRKMLPDLGVLVGSGIANLGLFYLIALL